MIAGTVPFWCWSGGDLNRQRHREIPDLLNQYSDHCLFQVRIVRRQALIAIAKALQ
jgi:hypothetical protein